MRSALPRRPFGLAILAVALVASTALVPVGGAAAVTSTTLGTAGLTRAGSPVSTGTIDDTLAVAVGACPATDASANPTNYVGITLNGSGWVDVPVLTTTTVGVHHDSAQSFPLSDTVRNVAAANGLPLPAGAYTLAVTCQDLTGLHASGQYVGSLFFLAGGTWVLGATAPSVPRTVIGSPRSGAVVVGWTAASSTLPVTAYRVVASPGGRGCTTTGARSCTVTGLVNGRAYTFRVRATSAVGTGLWSSPSAAVVAGSPSVPRSLVVKVGSRGAVATWSAPAYTNGSAVRSYQVRWRAAGSTTWTTWTSTKLIRTATRAGLRHGTVAVRAINARGAGPVAARTF